MELKVNLSFNELLEMIRRLPPEKKRRVQKALEDANDAEELKGYRLPKLLLKDPVMSEEGHQDYKNAREKMEKWCKL